MSISAINPSALSSTARVQGSDNQGQGEGNRKVALGAAATALGISNPDLRTALSGGQTIATVAQSKGISTSTVTDAVSSALSAANPSMSQDRAASVAARFVSGPGRAEGSGSERENDNDSDDRRPVPVSA